MKTRGHYIVSGRVQGVGFRYWTNKHATRLGLSGWVRNLASGEVEVYISGEEVAVEVLHEWLVKGPVGSRVDAFDDRTEELGEPSAHLPNAEGFVIRATV